MDELFEIWLAEQSHAYMDAINVPPRAWKLLDEICLQGGSISPSDHKDYGFNSSQNMRGQVQRLEQAGLVVSELEDTDQRRKTISVVAKGWLVRHHRSGYEKHEKARMPTEVLLFRGWSWSWSWVWYEVLVSRAIRFQLLFEVSILQLSFV
ncbi:hypothetical protein QWZ10_10920 [Paracoccus cavernae]|uniref:MarR family transcriptional regulator n=1 Tax=Paracoccus cavernae TaxID=1571207 RepID=A0ABT8D5V6_9RHOB|nr:hypothetical protein [Paracoccus cavernae]